MEAGWVGRGKQNWKLGGWLGPLKEEKKQISLLILEEADRWAEAAAQPGFARRSVCTSANHS